MRPSADVACAAALHTFSLDSLSKLFWYQPADFAFITSDSLQQQSSHAKKE